MKVLSTLFASLLFISISHAQLVISEYSASNLTDYADKYFKYEDWVEVTNMGSTTMDISGWYLSDKLDNPDKWQFPSGTVLNAQESIVIICSGRDLVFQNEIHTNFKLSQTSGKDQLILSNANAEEIHSTALTITDMDKSVHYDGTAWKITEDPTPGIMAANGNLYERHAIAPTISLQPGFYEGSQTVMVTNNEPNSVVRYTIDGTAVSNNDPIAPMSLTISNTTILNLRTFSDDPNVLQSRMTFATYFIDETFTLPVFSIGSDEVIDLANGDGILEPIASVEYFEDGNFVSRSFGEMNRHGKDSWGNPHRSLDFICRDEMGYSKAIDAELFKDSDRDEFQRLMFRASGDDNYPARTNSLSHEGSTHVRDEYVQTLAVEGGLELDCRKVRRVILFLNGQYWGVYGLREKVADHDYTEEYYDQGKYDIDFLSHWGNTVETYSATGAMDSWAELRDFILTNDMSDPDNYARVDDEIDLLSMIDYFLVNLNVVATDWLDWNTGWWRGINPDGKRKKWGYILWDMDATFDYYINYSGVPNVDYDAVPCDLEVIQASLSWGLHKDILLKLIDQNPDFRNLYINRYSDLANTAFSCETMLSTFDRMIGVIAPEMPRQIERWGGSLQEWEGNVDDLRLYIENRCALLNEGAIECYDELDETHDITLLTEPDGIGEIDFNTLDIESFPWKGEYFGDVNNTIKAKVFNEFDDQWEFSHWESKSQNEILPDVNTRRANITLTQSDTLIAVFQPITSVNEVSALTNLTIFPNPTKGVINIDFDLVQSTNVNLQITDLLGKQLHTESLGYMTSGYQQWSRDLSQLDLVSGIYLVSLQMPDGQVTKKVNFIR